VRAKEPALRIGQASAELGISPHYMRQLCKCGLVEAELSPGGQWRVLLSEIPRLQREGVPALPTFIEDNPQPPAPTPTSPSNPNLPPASPSPQVIDAFEQAEIEEAAARQEEAEVKRKESTIRRLRLELEEREVQDQVNARAVAQQAEARKLEEKRWHEAWVEKWAQYTLTVLPSDVPGPCDLPFIMLS
jgi:hypothetical protein